MPEPTMEWKASGDSAGKNEEAEKTRRERELGIYVEVVGDSDPSAAVAIVAEKAFSGDPDLAIEILDRLDPEKKEKILEQMQHWAEAPEEYQQSMIARKGYNGKSEDDLAAMERFLTAFMLILETTRKRLPK